jgi:hypothetical protein
VQIEARPESEANRDAPVRLKHKTQRGRGRQAEEGFRVSMHHLGQVLRVSSMPPRTRDGAVVRADDWPARAWLQKQRSKEKRRKVKWKRSTKLIFLNFSCKKWNIFCNFKVKCRRPLFMCVEVHNVCPPIAVV